MFVEIRLRLHRGLLYLRIIYIKEMNYTTSDINSKDNVGILNIANSVNNISVNINYNNSIVAVVESGNYMAIFFVIRLRIRRLW